MSSIAARRPRLRMLASACVTCALLAACPGSVPPGGGLSTLDGPAPDGRADAPRPDQSRDLRADLHRDLGADLRRDLLPVDLRAADVLSRDAPPAAPCATVGDKDTLVLLTFETSAGGVYPNVVGPKYAGVLRGGAVVPVLGNLGCGQAVHTIAANTAYVEIDHDKAFELTEGSFDLWVRFDVPGSVGLVSKDAQGITQSGHITLFRLCDGGLAVRLQSNGDHFRCTEPVPEGAWMHVGVNFGSGGLALFVDGQQGVRSGKVACDTNVTCGGTTSAPIDKNTNPWVIAASSIASGDGTAEPVRDHLEGLIDSLRISKKPRPFGTP